jgi:SHS family lactate transporter-like MFS transporter
MTSAAPSTSPALSRSDQWHAVTASFLGWTLDAFDFFVIVFLIDTLAAQFHVPKSAIVATIGYTLAMRPVGAVVLSYSVFLILRTIYGIGMGGEWGVGASLAMESAPAKWRGILSGVVQSGYSIGYLLAALAARFVQPAWGWRAMFWVGGVPALLAFYIRTRVREPEAWKQHRAPTVGAILRVVGNHWQRFCYLVLLITLMTFLSHGTQDLYPDFLKSARGFTPAVVSYIAILFNIGAIIGAISFGQLSQRLGRRGSMIVALLLSLAVIPAWAFGRSLVLLAVGAFIMQFGVQGAWGIIPAHLNELSPDAVRGLMTGLAYQLGVFFAAGTNTIEYALRDQLGYSWALAAFEITTIVLLTTVVALGSEHKGKSFLKVATIPAGREKFG